ncbi:MAG: diheme cytochrome c, partial [Gammaproteobacteria bacterium]|nr:diheme cytochrome c [Gammaproteobacteria bacterium]
LTVVSEMVLSEDDDHGKRQNKLFERSGDVARVDNPQYVKECGGCHFAYQPGLLPERSWRKVMNQLKNHFGDNAELPAPTHEQVLTYLVENSAERGSYRRSEKILRSIAANDAPDRITNTPYIRHKHDELPAKLVKGNDKVGSLSNCAACHTKAEQGSFREGEIRIPGNNRWSDD